MKLPNIFFTFYKKKSTVRWISVYRISQPQNRQTSMGISQRSTTIRSSSIVRILPSYFLLGD